MMAHNDFDACVRRADASRKLLGEIDGAVLAAGAAEGDHEVAKPRRWYAATLESTSELHVRKN